MYNVCYLAKGKRDQILTYKSKNCLFEAIVSLQDFDHCDQNACLEANIGL